jgi:hypothetical protein
MADRCYLEKCRDRLYPEFVHGGMAVKKNGKTVQIVYESGDDLIRKTPSFYLSATKRLNEDLGGAYRFSAAHFGGNNLYMDALKQNIEFAQRIGDQPAKALKRKPPVTQG